MKKRMLAILMAVLIAFASMSLSAYASASCETATLLSDVSLSDWMSAIRGETKLTEITMPGTHDSCAKTFKNDWLVSNTAKCFNYRTA